MNSNDADLNLNSKNKSLLGFSNEYNLNISQLSIFPVTYDCYIQISPDNNYIAFMKNNNSLEIYKKQNNNWKNDGHIKIFSFEKKKIKGINWSYDSNMILIYGSENNEKKSLIKAINKYDHGWECEIEFQGSINHSSFYPDSKSIVYIKSPINSLNIFSLLKHSITNSKNRRINKEKLKYEYLFLKYDDERSINYIYNNNNTFMILPCYGRTKSEKEINYKTILPSDCIIILANKKVFKCFHSQTIDLERIIPIKNKYSFFIVVEKDFYKLPFYIYNLYGQIMFKSEIPNSLKILSNSYLLNNNNLYGENKSKSDLKKSLILTNPCLLMNNNFETNFILVQEPFGKLEVLGCESILSLSEIIYYYNYNKLYDDFDNRKKNKNVFANKKNFYVHGNENKNNYEYNISSENYFDDNFINKKNILFLEEKKVDNWKNEENSRNGIIVEESIFSKKKRSIKLIKAEPFNVDKCYDENDYLLHAEISPIGHYICFVNQKYPKYLFFGSYYQSGVFKIIKFMKNILSFKWSSVQDILLVTLDSPIFYLITKDNYINYEMNKNYSFNNISWSPSGNEVILSNEENKFRMVAVLY